VRKRHGNFQRGDLTISAVFAAGCCLSHRLVGGTSVNPHGLLTLKSYGLVQALTLPIAPDVYEKERSVGLSAVGRLAARDSIRKSKYFKGQKTNYA